MLPFGVHVTGRLAAESGQLTVEHDDIVEGGHGDVVPSGRRKPIHDLERFQNLWQTGGVATTSELERMLRGASLRVTRPRMAVLAAVHEHPHADTSSIIAVVRRDIGDVSQQAVYDVLHALTEAGLVRRIHPEGSVARYESRVADNHHHLVCRSCGAIVDVDCAVGEAPCLLPADDHGFAIQEAEVIYWGVCPECSPASHPEFTP